VHQLSGILEPGEVAEFGHSGHGDSKWHSAQGLEGVDDPANLAFFGQIAVEPIATWPRFIDKDEVGAFGLQPAEKFIASALARPEVAKGDDLGVRCVGDVRNGNGLFMNISPDVECARRVHG
jgi:hypothetical protein